MRDRIPGVCVLVQTSNARVMLGGRLVGQFSAAEVADVEEEVRVTWLPDSCRECGPAAGLLPVRTCQEIGGRKEEKEGE